MGVTDVFVSYKAEDRTRLLPLISALDAEGFTVWWDAHIGGGTHWRDDIQEHLDSAKCVIVAWTKRSVGPGGDFVRDEAARARKRGTYLPIRLDSAEPPLGFGEVQAISLKGWKGDRSDPRFQAIAEAVRRRIAGDDVGHVARPHARPGLSRRALLAGGASVVALAGVGSWLLPKQAPANARRIAVLPFADLSPAHDQGYFSEGVAEELRSALSRIGLQVIGRNSSDTVKEFDIKTAAAKLDVANILTGSVRRSPDRIRINAQLVSGSDGVERWAESYDRAPGDAIKIQSDIAANVARALSIALGQASRAAIILGGTADSVAQDLILQSRELRRVASSAEALRRSVVLSDAAIVRDPRYADAYATKADALHALGARYSISRAEIEGQLAQAEAAARRAIAIAPKLGAAYAVLASIAQSRQNFAKAQRYLSQALALSPEDPDVLRAASRFLAWVGDGQEALRFADRLIALDPLNGVSYFRKAEALVVLRQYPQSIAAARRALEFAPDADGGHWYIGTGLTLLGQHAEARAAFRRMPADEPTRLLGEALVAARVGDALEARRAMARMEQLWEGRGNYHSAKIYAQLGEKDRAFAELEKAAEAKDPVFAFVKKDPFLDPIRSDPRYAALLRRLKFP